MAAKRYTAFCGNCYSSRLENVGIREAERWAVSHGKSCLRPDCHIVPFEKPAKAGRGGPGYSVPAERNPKRGGRKRARANPAIVTFSENPGRAAILSNRAYELRYKHAEDGHAYKHSFGAGVVIELLRDGSVRLFHKNGKSLWGDF